MKPDQAVWEAAVRHSRQLEDAYWTSDNIHEGVEPVIINIASDDEDGDDDMFLDSDEDRTLSSAMFSGVYMYIFPYIHKIVSEDIIHVFDTSGLFVIAVLTCQIQ